MNITFEVSTPELAEAIADKLIEAARENAQRREMMRGMLCAVRDGVEDKNLSKKQKARLRDYYVRETKAAGGASEELYAIAAAVRVQACIEKDREDEA